MNAADRRPRPPYRVSQLAERLGVHRDTVHGWIRDGVETPAGRVRLAALKIGGVLLVRRKDWRAFLRAQQRPATGPAPAAKTPKRGSLADRSARAAAELDRMRGKG